MARPFTRCGRLLAPPGLSPGVVGVCFLVLGYFGVVMFGVCAGQGVVRCSCCCGSCSCRRVLWSRSWSWWLRLVVVVARAVTVVVMVAAVRLCVRVRAVDGLSVVGVRAGLGCGL